MRTTLAAIALLAACDPSREITAEDVIVELEPAPATLAADGTSTATIRIATVTSDVKPGLKARLTVHGAAWLGEMEPTIEKALGPDGLATATLVASRRPGKATILAEIEGYERSASVTLADAAPTSLAFTTSGRLEAGVISQVQIAVQPIVPGGLPSAGTAVELGLVSEPPDTAYLTTGKIIMDDSATTVSTTVVASSTTTRCTVDVKVRPPGATAPSVTETISFGVLP